MRPAARMLLLLCLCAAAPVRAEDPEVAALKAEVAQIRAHLEAVEARLRVVEAGAPAAAIAAAPLLAPAVAAVPAAAPLPAPAPASAPVAGVPVAVAAPAVAAGAPVDAAASRRIAWRQLHEGMSESEVDALLGPATRRFELSGKLVRYYYYQGVGAGSVFFDSSSRITSVQHPPGAG